MAKPRLQLLSSPGGRPGDLGFKLTGVAREGNGLCRVWLRKSDPWARYLDPRDKESTWDVRISTKTDSAFVLHDEMGIRNLEELEERFTFENATNADELTNVLQKGDSVHDAVLAWARRVTKSQKSPPFRASAAYPAVGESA